MLHPASIALTVSGWWPFARTSSKVVCLTDRIAALQAAAKDLGLPPGFETRVMGRGRELEKTLNEFKWDLLALLCVHVHRARRSV